MLRILPRQFKWDGPVDWPEQMELGMAVGRLMPTVGRTIHWQIANTTTCIIVRITHLDYGPHVVEPAMLGVEYDDDAHAVRMPLSAGQWHYVHDCPYARHPPM
jgi:hypothetical protein